MAQPYFNDLTNIHTQHSSNYTAITNNSPPSIQGRRQRLFTMTLSTQVLVWMHPQSDFAYHRHVSTDRDPEAGKPLYTLK